MSAPRVPRRESLLLGFIVGERREHNAVHVSTEEEVLVAVPPGCSHVTISLTGRTPEEWDALRDQQLEELRNSDPREWAPKGNEP